MQESLSASACEKWLAPVKPVRLEDDALELAAPNDFIRDWIQGKYMPILEAAASDVLGTPHKIVLISLDLPTLSEDDVPEDHDVPRKIK